MDNRVMVKDATQSSDGGSHCGLQNQRKQRYPQVESGHEKLNRLVVHTKDPSPYKTKLITSGESSLIM
jgi:hypothetical protein